VVLVHTQQSRHNRIAACLYNYRIIGIRRKKQLAEDFSGNKVLIDCGQGPERAHAQVGKSSSSAILSITAIGVLAVHKLEYR
jgi:hypothetical protein